MVLRHSRGSSVTNRAKHKRTQKSALVLAFGENENDTSSIKELALALCPHLPAVQLRRRPLVLIKGRATAGRADNARQIAQVVRAESVRAEITAVLAHQDCDDVEPAHVALSDEIERQLGNHGIATVAATPAWELEAWWYLWPDAVSAVNSAWRRPNRGGEEVGQIANAKEQFRRDLRPRSKSSSSSRSQTRDYVESDSPKIAAQVRQLGIVKSTAAVSYSFQRFTKRLREVFAD